MSEQPEPGVLRELSARLRRRLSWSEMAGREEYPNKDEIDRIVRDREHKQAREQRGFFAMAGLLFASLLALIFGAEK